METIKLDEIKDLEALSTRLASVLDQGGLVCLPCNGAYRIVADLGNVDAVMEVLQSKQRTHKTPALIFVDSEARLESVAVGLHPHAQALARALWPQPLTIRIELRDELPRKVVKLLGGKKAKVGVRVPGNVLVRAVTEKLGRPLFVSSANRQKKAGESSPAQVRKTFAARVDVFIDAGDMQKTPSTVVDIVDGELSVERLGVISKEVLEGVLEGLSE